MSALATRAFIQAQGHYYLSPLAAVGKTPEQLQGWIEAAVSGQVALTTIERPSTSDEESLPVRGYEVCRTLEAEVEQQAVHWQERVFIVHSPTLAAQQQRGERNTAAGGRRKVAGIDPGPWSRQTTTPERSIAT